MMTKLVLLLGLTSFTFFYVGQAEEKSWYSHTCIKYALDFIHVLEMVNRGCYQIRYEDMIEKFPNTGTVTCQQCEIVTNFPDQTRSYHVKKIDASFMFRRKKFSSKIVKKNNCNEGIKVQIHCNFKAFIGDECVSDEDCYGSDTKCPSGVCSCKDDFTYIPEKGKCLKGNLRLGQICEVNSQCYPLNSYCKKEKSDNYHCSCIKDYLEDEYGGCYRVGLPLGSICEHDFQCISTNCGSVNSKSMKICSCPAYRIQINQSCHKSNIGLGYECKYNQQCNKTKFAWLCSANSRGNKVCSCLNRLVNFQDRECVQGNLHVGAYCDHNIQCGATPNATTCLQNSCSCDPGFVQKDSYCIEGNLHIGAFCHHDVQCEATPNAKTCLKNNCSCDPGYVQKGKDCIKGNLHIGAFCDHDLQCEATPNARTCLKNNCSCDSGFVRKGNNCIKETNKNPQALTREVTGSSNDAGVTIGALLGGLVLGALIVMTIGVLLYRKRNKYHQKSRKNEQSGVSNQAYDSEMTSESQKIGQKRNVLYSNVETESVQPKVSMVMPIFKQVDSDNLKAAPKDNIYNHLNETEGDERDDLYDHAHPIQEACVVQSDDDAYMHLQMTDGREDTDNQEEDDNYFTLEKEQK